MKGGFWESLVSAGEAGNALTGTSEASIIPPSSRTQYTQAPYFDALGEFVKMRLAGIISTVGSAPGTLTFNVKIGSVKVWTQATPTLAASLASKSWVLELLLSQYALGATSALRGIGVLSCDGIVTGKQVILLPDTSPANGSTFDSAVPALLDVTGQFSVTGNSLTVQQYNPVLPVR